MSQRTTSTSERESPDLGSQADAVSQGSAQRMQLWRVALCPLTAGAPFLSPRRRVLSPHTKDRLRGWCAELVPGVSVDIVEWVSPDPRHRPHAVVVAFPGSPRPSSVLYLKADDIARTHLAQALGTKSEPAVET